MKYISTFFDILDKYDLFIVDIWGVVHNDGVTTFDGVLNLLSEIKKLGKHVHFLSNSPGSLDEVRGVLAGIGITREYYDDVHTSGHETRLLLENNELGVGNKCFVIDSTRGIIDGTKIQQTNNLNEANFVLGSGIKNRLDLTVYDSLLNDIKAKNLIMVCPNPDIIVKTVNGELFCPGAIAKKYEELGGKVIYVGKPYNSVYKRIFDKYSIDKSRILGVGDGLNTDIKGANDFGIDSALIVKTGILSSKFFIDGSIKKEALHDYILKNSISPTYIIESFK